MHALTPEQAAQVAQAAEHQAQAQAQKKLKMGVNSNANTNLDKKVEGKSDARGALSGYIATLQSTRAWDALVHGNMS